MTLLIKEYVIQCNIVAVDDIDVFYVLRQQWMFMAQRNESYQAEQINEYFMYCKQPLFAHLPL